MRGKLVWDDTPGTLSNKEEEVVRRFIRNSTQNITTQCEQKRQRHHQVPHHGIKAGGLNPQQHHHGATVNGGNGSGEYALFWRARGDPAHYHRQGVTPCKSSATATAAAKGDLCIRSNSPSWLAMQARAEAAKGDLCSRSDSPSWLSVCANFFLFVVPFKAHNARYSSRS